MTQSKFKIGDKVVAVLRRSNAPAIMAANYCEGEEPPITILSCDMMPGVITDIHRNGIFTLRGLSGCEFGSLGSQIHSLEEARDKLSMLFDNLK
tara:strand:+ start:805 stop:1086 length:282 start_codon:yes stop_codon:yes gene_type:complete